MIIGSVKELVEIKKRKSIIMNIVKWLFCAILGYIFYLNVISKYKSFKRNEIKYNKDAVLIPKHLCTITHSDEKDLAPEVIEIYYQNKAERTIYKTIKWNDIISWEYGFTTHMNFNHTVWLKIVTVSESISVTDVYWTKMKRYFKKYVKEKQIINFSNKMETLGIILSYVIIIVLVYALFLRKH